MSFWDVIWFIIVSFAFIAYLMVMFSIVTDLFRDRDLSGWLKALWIALLIFFPFVTALVYLVVRGRGMAERQAAVIEGVRREQEDYIRRTASAGASPAEDIARAKALLDEGTITQEEFAALKAKALS